MLQNNVLLLSQTRIMTKTAFMLLILMGLTVCAFSQSRKYDHFADPKLKLSKEAGATYGVISTRESGLYKLDFYSLTKGNLVESNHYKDDSGKEMEGLSISYHDNGKIEWQGKYKNNEADKLWIYTDSLGRITDSIVYDKGEQQFEHNIYFSKTGKVNGYKIVDAVTKKAEEKIYFEDGKLQSEVNFTGDKGVLKEYDSLGNVKTTLLSAREMEASFPGGAAEFRKFLERNLNANTPIEHGAPKGIYTVIVKFRVAKDGTVSDIRPETNAGFGMEQEVVRLIRRSPSWTPAVQFGRIVNAYRRQPVTFVVEEEKRRRRD